MAGARSLPSPPRASFGRARRARPALARRAIRTPSGSARSCCSRPRLRRSSRTTHDSSNASRHARPSRGPRCARLCARGRAWATTHGRAICIARRARWPRMRRLPGQRQPKRGDAFAASGDTPPARSPRSRSAVPGVGWQHTPRACTARRLRWRRAFGTRRGALAGACCAHDASTRHVQPGVDGIGRHAVHAARTPMRALPFA